jgi:hypothetical protein
MLFDTQINGRTQRSAAAPWIKRRQLAQHCGRHPGHRNARTFQKTGYFPAPT